MYLASHELLQLPSEQKVSLGEDSHSTEEQFFTKKERPGHQVLPSHAGSLNLDSSHSPIYFKNREEGEMSELRVCLIRHRTNQTSQGKVYSAPTSCLLICFPPCGICKKKPAYAKCFICAQMSWQWLIRVIYKKKKKE